MKKTTVLLLMNFLFVCLVSAQNRWVNTSPFKLGIGTHKWTVNDVYHNFRYEQIDNVNGNSGALTVGESNSFTHTRMPMVFENIGENLHHETSVTGAWDLLWDALNGIKTVYDGGPEARRFEMFRTHWAGGGWIQEKIGIFGGAQYAYSTIRLQDPSVPDEMIVGGNQRGFHLTGMYNAGPTLIKTRLMYDWIRMSKRQQKGSGVTVDIQAYYSFTESGSLGAFGSYQFKTMTQSGPSGTPTNDWKNKGIQNQGVANFSYNFPDITARSQFVSFGLYAMLFGNN